MSVALLWIAKQCLEVFDTFADSAAHLKAFAILTKLLEPTRLETRTKESNICASIRVANPDA